MNQKAESLTVLISKIAATVLEYALFCSLLVTGWKRKTVYRNLEYTGEFTGFLRQNYRQIYIRLLRNLSHHVSEIVIRFNTYKRLPTQVQNYPCKVDREEYDIDNESRTAIEQMKQGGIFLTAHYGNYEAIGPWLCRLGIPLKASYIPQKPAWFNRILEERIRAVDGKKYSVNAKTPRDFLKLIDGGNLFCLLMDQDSRIPSARKGTFLGRMVHINPLPHFLLKHRPETPVYICWIKEEARGKSKVLHASRIEGEAAEETFNLWLENQISENPNFWYGWTHRRFKSTMMRP